MALTDPFDTRSAAFVLGASRRDSPARRPTEPGPQPHNQIAGTLEGQLRRARGRPRRRKPLRFLVRRLRAQVRRLRADLAELSAAVVALEGRNGQARRRA